MANRAAGKGYENEAFYENMKFKFLGIENIHVMRSSLQKLIDSRPIDSKPSVIRYITRFTISSLWAEITNDGWIFEQLGIIWMAQAYSSYFRYF